MRALMCVCVLKKAKLSLRSSASCYLSNMYAKYQNMKNAAGVCRCRGLSVTLI